MEREPGRKQHDLYRHDRNGAPGDESVERQHQPREYIRPRCAAARADRFARTYHVRGIDRVADHLEREISFHARAQVEGTVVKQRPAAMVALDAAQIGSDLGLQRGVDRLGQIVPQQNVFRRNGRVRLEFEYPMSVRPLQGKQRAGRRLDAAV
jgi:hypothetical protein